MSSVSSSPAAAFPCTSDRNDQLTQSARAGHDSSSPYHIPDSRVTVELIRLRIATIVQPRVCNAPHPLEENKGVGSLFAIHSAAGGGPLTFQRNEAITPGRVAATWPNAMIAAGNIS